MSNYARIYADLKDKVNGALGRIKFDGSNSEFEESLHGQLTEIKNICMDYREKIKNADNQVQTYRYAVSKVLQRMNKC